MNTIVSDTSAREAVTVPWIVWSNEHRAFWAPNRQGYTTRIERAGRYSQEEAEGICRGANYRANSTINVGTPPEICMPAPEALASLPSLSGEWVLVPRSVLQPFLDAAPLINSRYNPIFGTGDFRLLSEHFSALADTVAAPPAMLSATPSSDGERG